MSAAALEEAAAWEPDAGDRAVRGQFMSMQPFPPDPFQAQAFDALDGGSSVLVSAPTGSGKTLVAAYGVHRARAARGKAFYTTPLKALSNQKYGELVAAHGSEEVGLLTGDTSVRPGAPIVVMTTEVLRNMLLAGSELLNGLHTVILDEVHYLQDPYRGGVWEEVLVLSPEEVVFVCLSATVSNAGELGAWLRSVRGRTEVIVERERPVVLRHHFALYRRDNDEIEIGELLEQGRVSERGLRADQRVQRSSPGRQQNWHGGGPRDKWRLPYRSPHRSELVLELGDRDLLPMICFIFSRAACDDAVRQCLRDGLRLTEARERRAIRAVAEAHVASLTDEDLSVLGYPEWLEGLENGLSAHHAGLVPAFKETVEECFAAGLLRVVFATETLSLGINMPARSVVIERFTKFGGAGRAPLTSGEYAQLTGRAGRRGLDDEGHSFVLFSPETTFAQMARVAAAPPPDLRSAFRPTYNLAVNMVGRFDRARALELLRRSFAQWQTPKSGATPGRDTLAELFARRLAVLEELGYIKGWHQSEAGSRLARIYHESDLLVAEALRVGVLGGAEPSVLAGVLSTLVFERRRARHSAGHGSRHEARNAKARRPKGGDRVGERRRVELSERIGRLAEGAERIRAVEEVHLVPRSRQPEPGLAGAICAWARGATFAQALGVAAADVGELAPGDFVRTVKQVADLVEQVAAVALDPEMQAAAREASFRLLRDVVAAGGPELSATGGTPHT